NDKPNLIKFLVELDVIRDNIKCELCDNIVQLDIENLEFKCTKSYYVTDNHKKRRRIRCTFRQSAKESTWFEKSNLSIEKIYILVVYFIMLRSPRHDFIKNELEISDHTIVDWHNFYREVCIYWIEKHSEKIGDEGKIVK
ncbi:hypothetical protein EAI_00955, partial [Harpegnathos saltator]